MAYIFTAAEQAQIEAARDLCPAGDALPTTTGNWVPFYQMLSDLIGARIDSGTVTGADLQDLKNAKLWLDVAIGANGGKPKGVSFDFRHNPKGSASIFILRAVHASPPPH